MTSKLRLLNESRIKDISAIERLQYLKYFDSGSTNPKDPVATTYSRLPLGYVRPTQQLIKCYHLLVIMTGCRLPDGLYILICCGKNRHYPRGHLDQIIQVIPVIDHF